MTSLHLRPSSTLFPYTTLFRSYRWLNESLLKVDRGVEFYNKHSVPYDGLFWLNRLWLLALGLGGVLLDRKSTRLNSSHVAISYAVFCLKKKKRFCIYLEFGY